jgi:release factor glutamine methyltransferase
LRRNARSLFAGDAAPRPSPTPLLDCECLLAAILGVPRSGLLAHDDVELRPDQFAAFTAASDKRRQGLPVAYITGVKEFFGLEFCVTPDVLIPKPDTELLVEQALSFINTPTDAPRPLEAADICCGSGCVAIAVLANTDCNIRFTATDISEAALAVARENADRLLPPRKRAALAFVHADLFTPLAEAAACPPLFDLILANPPYVPTQTAFSLLRDGRSEPLLALDGGEDGLRVIRRLIAEAMARLDEGGYFLLECGEYHIAQAKKCLQEHGFGGIAEFTDLGGNPRLLCSKKGL